MLAAKLDEITEQRHARDFREIFNLWDVCSVEVTNSEEDERNEANADI